MDRRQPCHLPPGCGPVPVKVKGSSGHPALWRVTADGLWLPHADTPNQVQAHWAFIVAQLLRKKPNYAINAMYLEYENVADPDDVVTAPSFAIDEGQDYYESLSSSGSRDFLRVALWGEPTLSINVGDEAYFAEGEGNKLTFKAESSGTAGVHGKPFSAGVNSKVFGVALVATPVFADRTQDVVYSRAYYAADKQIVKSPSQQIGATWPIVLHVT